VVGHEQGRNRPVLVVSSDALHRMPSRLVTVVPITSVYRRFASHVEIRPREANLRATSFAMAEQVRTISTARLGRRLGAVDPETIDQVDELLRWLLDL
jgi:mRNA interferase MazF